MDWNLLPILERLLETKSVTQTAAQTGVGVPAISRALGRLRVEFSDPLLVRAGNRFVLTSFASRLQPELKETLSSTRSLYRRQDNTPLSQSTQTFKVICTDAVACMLAEPLTRDLRAEAPGLALHLIAEESFSPRSLRQDDIHLAVSGWVDFPRDIRASVVGNRKLVGMIRKRHPALKGRTKNRLSAQPQVIATNQLPFEAENSRAWAKAGIRRTVVLYVPSFFAAAAAVSSSDLIGTAPSNIAHYLESLFPIECFELEVRLPAIKSSVAWHPRNDSDPVHRWLRERIIGHLQNFSSRFKPKREGMVA